MTDVGLIQRRARRSALIKPIITGHCLFRLLFKIAVILFKSAGIDDNYYSYTIEG